MPFPNSLSLPVPTSFTGRFSATINGLCRALEGRRHSGPMTLALFSLIGLRVTRLAGEVRRLVEAYQAGTLRPRAPAAPRPARVAGEGAGEAGGLARAAHAQPERAKPDAVLPRGFAWLVRLVPDATNHASALLALLSEAEHSAMLAACPRLVRLLKPLCRMLGVSAPELPGGVAPAPRIRVERVRVARVRFVRVRPAKRWELVEPEARAWAMGPARRRSRMCCPYRGAGSGGPVRTRCRTRRAGCARSMTDEGGGGRGGGGRGGGGASLPRHAVRKRGGDRSAPGTPVSLRCRIE